MRREVNIYFGDDGYPGGAQAILDATGCGPDVAIIEKLMPPRKKEPLSDEQVRMLYEMIMMFRATGPADAIELVDDEEPPASSTPSTPPRLECVTVTLDANDERLRVLLDILSKHNITWRDWRRDYYTEEELESARLIIMAPLPERTIFGGPRVGTLYDLKDACRACGAGARQTSALMIDAEDVRNLEGLRVASTFYCDTIVDERLAEELECADAKGLSFRSIYAVMKGGRQTKLRWRQLCAARSLPRMSPRSTGVKPYRPCSSCDRSGHAGSSSDPPRLAYRARDVADIDDVMTTWEWFGDVKFNGDVSEALFAYPWFLLSPKVMRILREAGAPAFEWLPIRVVDEE